LTHSQPSHLHGEYLHTTSGCALGVWSNDTDHANVVWLENSVWLDVRRIHTSVVGFQVRADNWGGDVGQELRQFIQAFVEFVVAESEGIILDFIHGVADLLTTIEREEESPLYCFR